MPNLCSECSTENRSDATVCVHCANALPTPAPAPRRMSILERTMAPAQPEPAAEAASHPAAVQAAVAAAAPTPVAAPAPQPAPASVPQTPAMPKPRPRQVRKRSRTPWMLAIVMLVALLAALGYEQMQTAKPAPAPKTTSP